VELEKAMATEGGPTSEAVIEFVEKQLCPGHTLLESYEATEIGGMALGRLPGTQFMTMVSFSPYKGL
jgi:hypothetical protein